MESEPIYKKNPMLEPYDAEIKEILKEEKQKCTLCYDTGWLIEAKDRSGVVTMEIIPCLIPDCEKSGQPVKLLSLNYMKFTSSNHHPHDNYIMSVEK